MANYRRNFVPGGTYFFTVVTAQRTPLLSSVTAVGWLRQATAEVRAARPFEIVAAVVLPDHLHMIWTLPAGDADYPTRWSAIKAAFTRTYLRAGGEETALSDIQRQEERRGVWQRRFFEHTIRDEADLTEHIDYIHFNPVKHGLSRQPVDWPYSSLHAYIQKGILRAEWGTAATKGEPGDGVCFEMVE